MSPEERAVAREQLAAIERALRANPLLGYEPHDKQVVFHASRAPLRAFFGGNRSGKTTAGILDRLVQQVDRELVPDHLSHVRRWEPPVFGRVVTPDLTGTMKGVVHQKVRDWCPPGQLKGGSFDRAFDKVDRMLYFRNGSWIQFMSNDQDLDKFGGSALHWILYDEEPRQDIRRECLTRLIDYDGEELFTMTPLNGMSWTYDEVYEPWERLESDGRDPDQIEAELEMRVVVVDMDDNPHLSERGKARALAGYTGEEREARKSGRFVSFAGLIYPMFSTSRHVTPDEDELPEGVEVFEGLDPGMRHMAAVVFCYLDHEDRLVVYDELALRGQTVGEVCKAIQQTRLRWGRRQPDGKVIPVAPRFTIIDPAARNKSPQTGRSDQQEYADHGIYTLPGQNDVRPGINRVRERLEADRLLVAARCTELRQEFKKYRWKRDSSRTEDDPRDRPVKKDDHLLDALRYVCMARPLAPREEPVPNQESYKQRALRESLKRLRQLGGRGPVDHPSGPGIFA